MMNQRRTGHGRKILSIIMTLVMIVSLLSTMPVKQVSADEGTSLTAEEDTTSTYTPTQIVNGSFDEEPWMDYDWIEYGTMRKVVSSGVYFYDEDLFSPWGESYDKEDIDGGYAIPLPNGVDCGWNTTEIYPGWGSLFEYWSGKFVEMNLKNSAALYQDLTTHGGDVIRWSLGHKARNDNDSDESQSMRVEIGAPMPDTENPGQYLYAVANTYTNKWGISVSVENPVSTNITDASLATYTTSEVTSEDGWGYGNPDELQWLTVTKDAGHNDEWHTAAGIYIVPPNQTVTRFAFVSMSETPDTGNFLDDITFSTLIGNLSAMADSDNNVTVKGYWGDTDTEKKLKIKIGEQTKDVTMSSVSNKNFKITIPSSLTSNATKVEVYHEDYESAKKEVKISHTHEWTYAAGTGDAANTLYAYCSKQVGDCAHKNLTNALAVNLVVNAPISYTGNAVTFSKDGTSANIQLGGDVEDWEELGLSDFTVQYYKEDGTTLTSTTEGAAASGGAPSKVGTYYVKVSVGSGDGLRYISKSFSINKLSQVINADPVTATYGDTGKLVSASLTTGDGTLSYSVTSGDGVVSVNASTGALTILKAGEAVVTVSASETDEYAAATKTVNVSVGQKEVGVTWTNTSFTYNGTAQGPTATVNNKVGTDEVGVTLTNGQQTSVGNYTAEVNTLTGAAAANYKLPATKPTQAYSIIKATPACTAPTAGSAYVGQTLSEIGLTGGAATATINGETNYISGSFSWVDGSTSIPSEGAHTYSAKFVPQDSDNFNTVNDIDVNVNAAKRAQTITADNVTAVYGDTDKLVDAHLTTGDGTLSYTVKSGADVVSVNASTGALTTLKAGTAVVTVTAAATTGYLQQTKDVTVTVNQKEVSVAWTNTSFTYDGTAKAPTATVNNKVGTDVVEITVTGQQTNAGTGYTATANALTGAAAANYKLPATKPTQSFSIGKATPVCTAPTADSAYVGQTLSTVALNGGAATISGTDTAVEGTFTWMVGTTAVPSEGAHTYSAKFVPSDSNNFNTVNDIDVNVNAAKRAQTITAPAVTAVYGDTDKLVTASATDNGSTLSYTVKSGADVVSVNASTGALTTLKAGTAVITVTAAATTGYLQQTKDVTVTVNQKEVSVTWTNTSFTYDGTAKAPTATVNNKVGTDVVEITVTGQQTNAGTVYTATANELTGAAAANYKLPATKPTQSFSIGKATPACTAPTAAGAYVGQALSEIGLTGGTATATISGTDTAVEGTFIWMAGTTAVPSEGAHTYSAKFVPTDSNNFNTVNDISVTVTAVKRAQTITADNVTAVYGDTDKSVTASATDNGSTLSYTVKSGADVVSVNASTGALTTLKAGTAVVTVTAAATTGYLQQTKDVTVTVNQKEVSVTWTNTSFTYDGTAKAPTATVNNKVGTDVVEITVTGQQTNAGTVYTATANELTGAAAANYKLPATKPTQSFSIGKATPACTAPTAAGAYVGQALSEIGLTGGTATATISGTDTAVEGTFIWMADTTVIPNAGTHTYSVKFVPTDLDNFFRVNNVSVTVTAVKRAQTITAADVTAVYGDADKKVTAATTGDGTLSYEVTSGDDVASVDPETGDLTFNKAGSATVTVTASETTGYLQQTKDVTVTVGQKEVGVTWANTSLTYDGTAQAPTATVNNKVGTDVVEIIVTGQQTDVGTGYVATANELTGAAAAKYVLPATNPTQSFSIVKATPSCTAPAADSAYVGQTLSEIGLTDGAATANISGTDTAVEGTFTWMVDTTVIPNAGTHTYSVKFVPTDSGKFNTVENISVTVTAVKREQTISAEDVTAVYGDTDKKVTAATTGDGSLSYEVTSGDDVASVDPQTGVLTFSTVGTATVTVTASATTEYEQNTKSVNVTVGQKTVGIEWSATALIYNGSEQAPIATATGKISEAEEVTVTVAGGQTKAGTDYTATASGLTGAASSNYKLPDSKTTTYAIAKAVPECTAPTGLTAFVGQKLSDIEITGGSASGVEGTFKWADGSIELSTAGSSEYMIVFAPKDNDNYETVSDIPTSVNVKKKSQTVTADNVSAYSDDSGMSVTAAALDEAKISFAVVSGDSVVSVDAQTGALTILSAGTATIRATAAETAAYETAYKDVMVTVTARPSSGGTADEPTSGSKGSAPAADEPSSDTKKTTSDTKKTATDKDENDVTPATSIEIRTKLDDGEETVSIEATVNNDGIAELTPISDEKLEELIMMSIKKSEAKDEAAGKNGDKKNNNNKNGDKNNNKNNNNAGESVNLTLDFSDADASVVGTSLDKQTAEKIVDVINDISNTVDNLEVKTSNGSIILNGTALDAIAEAGEEKTDKILLVVTTVQDFEEQLTEEQKQEIANVETLEAVEAYVLSGETVVHDLNGGIITVRIDYPFDEDIDPARVDLVHMKSDGKVEHIAWRKVIEDGKVYAEFDTTSLSYFTYTYDRDNYVDVTKAPDFEIQKKQNTDILNSGFSVIPEGKTVKVTWSEVEGADGYQIFANYCSRSFGKAVKTIKASDITSATFAKLGGKMIDTTKSFKVRVRAYKVVYGKKVTIGKTIIAHLAGNDSAKYTNPVKINLSTYKVSLNVGETAQIDGRIVLADKTKKELNDKHAKKFRFESSDRSVATVNTSGVITAAGKGKCIVYVYAKNGLARKVTVNVTDK